MMPMETMETFATLVMFLAALSATITASVLLTLLRISASQRAQAPHERDAAQAIARDYLAYSAYRAATRSTDGTGLS